MQLKQTAESLWSDAKTYWKHPPAGKYMPFKEIAAYSVGGIGAYFIITIIWALQLSVGNFIIGNAIGYRADQDLSPVSHFRRKQLSADSPARQHHR